MATFLASFILSIAGAAAIGISLLIAVLAIWFGFPAVIVAGLVFLAGCAMIGISVVLHNPIKVKQPVDNDNETSQ